MPSPAHGAAHQGTNRADPDGRGELPAALLNCERRTGAPQTAQPETIIMSAIIALVLLVVVAILAVTFLSAVIHLLFSPWILLAAIGVFAWVKLRPRRTN